MKTVVFLSGVSGAGKTRMAHVFEELGYRVIENTPNAALPAALEEIANNPSYDKTLLINDIRHAAKALRIMKERQDVAPYFILLDCQKSELLSRYRLTRHTHPLQSKGLTLEACIDNDAEALRMVRQMADLYIDTTGLTPADLRSIAMLHVKGKEKSEIVVAFSSFGYKYGIPADADIVFDCRNIPNPFWIPELRPFTGRDQPIIDYLEGCPEVEPFFELMKNFLSNYLASAEANGRSYATIAIGCSGGQHRSVYFAERLYNYFKDKRECVLTHREMHRYVKGS